VPSKVRGVRHPGLRNTERMRPPSDTAVAL
jgi:hypothetical protein